MFLTPWLRSLKHSRQSKSARKPRPFRQAPMCVEHLEDRTLLAVGSMFIQATGTLLVATDTSDDVSITVGGSGEVLINGANPQTGPLQAAVVRGIDLSGGQGANNLDLSGVTMAEFVMLPATGITVKGGDGADTITASPIGGLYNGQHGHDLLIGSIGNDTLDGDDGADTLLGLGGDDVLIGEDGDDVINGGGGNDTIFAGDGQDVANGNDGNDSIDGGNGLDTLNGNGGNDFIDGGYSQDVIDGGAGNDTIFGGADADLLNGGDGDDQINGQAGEDTINGDAGNDTLIGGTQNDLLNGGVGDDNLSGEAGNDTLDGSDGDDTADGGDGEDSILGGAGNDSLLGGIGQDTIDGNQGDDTIFGNSGNDTLFGGGGADVIDGGTGNDLVQSAPEPIDPGVLISVNDVSITEGDVGTRTAVFTVTLSRPATSPITVNFTTVDGLAVSGQDYAQTSGMLQFNPGDTSRTVSVTIISDTMPEPDENFFLSLSNPVGATFLNPQGVGVIVNDDAAAGGDVDIFLLFDDTSSFSSAFTTLAGIFPQVISDLQTALPGSSLAFGMGRFEEYPTGGAFGNTIPYVLNQPIVLDSDPQFTPAITAALNRFAPASGSGRDETAFEALFQVATGVGFDGNMDGDTTDNGPAGLVSTQVAGAGATGDVPAFSTFMPDPTGDPNGPVLPPAGNVGGVGWRDNVQRIVILASDAPNGFDFNPDGVDPYVGVGGVTVPASQIQGGAISTAPSNGASIQQTIDALIAEDIQVIGLGTDSGLSPFSQLRSVMEGISTLTGGTNQGTSPIDSGIGGDMILPGEPLYFLIDPGNAANISNGIVNGVLGAVAPPQPAQFSINDVTLAAEGNVGTTNMTFTVTLSEAPSSPVTVDFSTVDGSATAGMDYVATSGTLTFGINQTTQTINVPVIGDSISEFNETFFVTLSNPTGGPSIVDSLGVGTITDDDRIDLILDTIGDTLSGGDGNDTVQGASGDDIIVGGSGADLIDGFRGNDTISGSAGADTLLGGDGNDLLDGGRGTDIVRGEMGNDTITWESFDGSDDADGGFGFDEMQVRTLTHNDRITVGAVGDGRFSVHHRIPSDPAGDTVRGGMMEVLSIDSDGGADRITIEDLTGVQWLQQVNVDAGRGSDIIDATAQANGFIMISLMGGEGADTVISGAGNDFIDGGEGNDSLMGGAGNDTINGGMGVDRLHGGDGDDVLSGNNGRDFLYGEAGNDTLSGGNQNDDLYGGTGRDLLLGGLGDDSLLGEAHEDTLFGGDGDDTLRGGTGNDEADGEAGVDSVDGGAGNDILRGGADGDTVVGGDGDDLIFGGNGLNSLLTDGNDFLNGNAGNDTISGERGQDTLLGGAGHDELDGGFGHDQLNGNAGNDTMRGGDGDDLMRGGMGNDTLNGGHGEDTLYGEDGDDALSGHDGHDRLNGGGGNDTLHGGDGDDTLRGGANLDLLIGHDGQDDLDGQGGDGDTLVGSDAFDILNDNGGLDTVDNKFVFVADWIDAI